MTREEHLEKASRVLASLRKLAFPEDYLATVDGAMIAGYHLGNALLHRHGVLPATAHANSPSKLDVPLEKLPAAVRPAFRAFAELERLRFEYVRSPSSCDAALATAVRERLEVMRRANK